MTFENDSFRFCYVLFSDILFLSWVSVLTAKRVSNLPKIPQISNQFSKALFIYAIFFVSGSFTNFLLIKVKEIDIVWLHVTLLAFISIIALFICSQNREKLNLILGINFKSFLMSGVLLFFIFGILVLPGGMPMLFDRGSIIPKIFFAALIEEVFARAYLQTRCEAFLGPTRGLFLASGLFASLHLTHLFAGHSFTANFMFGILLNFLGGLLFGFIYLRTRSIVPSTLLHTFGNLLF